MPPRKTTTAAKKTVTNRAAKAAPVKAAKPAARKATKAAVSKAVDTAASTLDGTEFVTFLTDLRNLVDKYLSPIGTVAAKADAAQDDDTDDEPEEVTRESREAELRGWSVKKLQDELIKADYDETDVRPEKSKDVLITNILNDQFGEDEDEDTEDDADEEDAEEEDEEEDDEDEDEDDELDRDTLMGLSLSELKKTAVEYGVSAADVKGKDKDTIADLIIEASEAAEDDDEEDEDGEEGDYWTEDDLTPLPIAEIRGIANEADISFPKGIKKAELIKLIVA